MLSTYTYKTSSQNWIWYSGERLSLKKPPTTKSFIETQNIEYHYVYLLIFEERIFCSSAATYIFVSSWHNGFGYIQLPWKQISIFCCTHIWNLFTYNSILKIVVLEIFACARRLYCYGYRICFYISLLLFFNISSVFSFL